MQRALRDVIAIAGDAERKRIKAMADGSVKPAQAASARCIQPETVLPLCRHGCLQAPARTDKARPSQHSSVREPAPPCDKFGAEVAPSAQWGRQRCQSKPQKNKKDRPWSAVIGRVIRHTFAFMICNELINNKRNSITKFDINLEKNTSMCTTQF